MEVWVGVMGDCFVCSSMLTDWNEEHTHIMSKGPVFQDPGTRSSYDENTQKMYGLIFLEKAPHQRVLNRGA